MSSITGYVKDKFRNLRLINALAEEYYLMKQDEENESRTISSDRFEEYDTHILIDERTYVRCIVGGMIDEDADVNTLPPEMTSRALERIMALSHSGCKVDVSTGVIKISRSETNKELKEAYISNSIDQDTAKKHTQGSINDIQLENEASDIRATYNDIYYSAKNVLNATFIITVMGDEKEVFVTESKVTAILEAEIISYMIPYNMMKAAFVASRLYPVSDENFWIRVDSDIAATLCVSTSLNSRLDSEGLLFGKDRKTNADVVVDLSSLPSKHMMVFGPTRSGKTFSMTTLQMRLYSMLGKRVIYMTPKPDTMTDFRAAAEYFGEHGGVIDLGESGQPINPLRIIHDEKSMGSSPDDYSRSYLRHIRILKTGFSVYFEQGEFSSNIKGYLEDMLNFLYREKGIYRRQPDTWKGAFPIMSDLWRKSGQDMKDKSLSRETQRSAGALHRKLSAFGPDGSLNYMNVDVALDLSKDYLVVYLGSIDEEIRDFMYVLVAGIVSSRFKTDLEKETSLIVDEARVFFRSEQLTSLLLDTVAMGGALGYQLIMMTQNPVDLIKNNVDQEFKANMSLSLIFGATLDQTKAEPIKDYFGLPDSAVQDLLNCEPGEGLLLISSRQEIIPLRVEATTQETDVIKGRYLKKKPSSVITSRILPEYEPLKNHHGVILKKWIEGDETYLISEGWEKVSRLQKYSGKGTFSMYVPKGAIKGDLIELPGLGSMTLDHFSGAVELESYLVSRKIECSSNHNGGVDLEFKIGDKTYAAEIERSTRSAEELIKKRDRLLSYDDYRFICAPGDFDHVSKAVDKTILRGGAFTDWIDSLF